MVKICEVALFARSYFFLFIFFLRKGSVNGAKCSSKVTKLAVR